MKDEKIEKLIKEFMDMAPRFRKSFANGVNVFEGKRISPHQHFCLMIIFKHGEIAMSELASQLGVSKQQLTRIVDYLVVNNWVERYPAPTNRRTVLAKLTPDGKKFIISIPRSYMIEAQDILSDLSEEDIDAAIIHVSALKNIFAKIK